MFIHKKKKFLLSCLRKNTDSLGTININSKKRVSFYCTEEQEKDDENEAVSGEMTKSLGCGAEQKEQKQLGVDNVDNSEKEEMQNEEKERFVINGAPKDYDILCGRGNGVQNHPGNLYFRDLLREHKESYMKAYNTKQKKDVVRRVICAAKAKGCRFIKPFDESLPFFSWICLSQREAERKTSQAIRDTREKSEARKENVDEEVTSYFPHKKISEKENYAKTPLFPPRPTNACSAPPMVTQQRQRLSSLYKQISDNEKYINELKRKQQVMEEEQKRLLTRFNLGVAFLQSQNIPKNSNDHEGQMNKRRKCY